MPPRRRKKLTNPTYYFALVGALLLALGWFSGYWWSHRQPETCACACLMPPVQVN